MLGTGAIGSRVARVLLARGSRVTVWNRTAARADPLLREGAVVAATASDAVAASSLVIASFTGYAAVHAVLRQTGNALRDRTFVALTTGSPQEAREAARQAAAAGARYLDGGLRSGPEAIGTEAAMIFYSGPPEVFEEYRNTLAVLGAARYAGADPGAAAVLDLALFGLWYDAQLGYLRALETVRAAGVDLEDFAPMAAAQLGHVVAGAEDTAREVVSRTFPRGPADLTEHEPVLRKLVALRSGQRLGDGRLDVVLDVIGEHIARGRGKEGLNSVLDHDDQNSTGKASNR